jgi:hypothetical protein
VRAAGGRFLSPAVPDLSALAASRRYSFAVRWRAGFLAARFADPTRLAPLGDDFWGAFFVGARLKAQPTPGRRQPAVGPRLEPALSEERSVSLRR